MLTCSNHSGDSYLLAILPGGKLSCNHFSLRQPLGFLIDKFRGTTCMLCSYAGKNQWLCLNDSCYFVGCGPKGFDHGTKHSQLEGHAVSVNLHNAQLFCQQCHSRLCLISRRDARISETDVSIMSIKSGIALSECNLDWSDKPPGTCGLQNLGNTCYMNAALQTLSNCPQLSEHFLQCSVLLDDYRLRLVPHYQEFLAKAWLPPRSNRISPMALLREMKYLYPMFAGFAQHDAQEFLRVFLNRLHDELKTTESRNEPQKSTQFPNSSLSIECNWSQQGSVPNPMRSGDDSALRLISKRQPQLTSSPSPSLNTSQSSVVDDAHPRPVLAGNDDRSIITDVFQGKLVSAVRCLSCKQFSCREEVFLDLSLSLRRPDTKHSPDACSPVGGSPRLPSEPIESLKPSARLACENVLQSTSPQANGYVLTTKSHASLPAPLNRYGALQFLAHLLNLLAKPRLSIPLVRRFLVRLIAMFTLSFAWIFSRITDFQSWLTRPELSLNDCLSDYFSQAELNGENKYYCDRCKMLCNGLNQTALVALPEVLCIHLKRFRSHSMDASKITSPVIFPLEGLEFGPYLHPDCRDRVTTYDLIGVICHRGDCGGGHYVACALNWHRNTWYEYDDDRVFEMKPHHVEQLTTEAYILFYKKRDICQIPLRNDAELLLHQHLTGSVRSTVYISRPWFVRFSTWAEPGPISNAEFLCEHGRVRPQLWCARESVIIPIPEELWNKLSHEFGGGPLVREVTLCMICRDAIVARQHHELVAFNRVLEQYEVAGDSRCSLYAISNAWFEAWKDFVGGKSLRIPGAIDNSDIMDYRSPRYLFSSSVFSSVPPLGGLKQNQPRLKIGSLYTELVEGCWTLLSGIYGGGPVICVRQAVSLPVSQPEPAMATEGEEEEVEMVDSVQCSPQSLDASDMLSSPTISSLENYACSQSSDTQNDIATVRSLTMMSMPHLICSQNSSVSNLIPTPNAVLMNGDSESGVYSATERANGSEFSSIAYSSSDAFSGVYPLMSSLSAENLTIFAKGDCKACVYSIDRNGVNNGLMTPFNGLHSHSYENICSVTEPEASPLIAGDSSSLSTCAFTKSHTPLNGSAHRSATLRDHPEIKKSRLSHLI